MKKQLFGFLFSLSLISHSQSALLTFEFSGYSEEWKRFWFEPDIYLGPSALMTGTITIDTKLASQSYTTTYGDGFYGNISISGGVVDFNLQFAGQQYSSSNATGNLVSDFVAFEHPFMEGYLYYDTPVISLNLDTIWGDAGIHTVEQWETSDDPIRDLWLSESSHVLSWWLDFPENEMYPEGHAYGSGSIRVSAVPVPAAAWLFGSALVGLASIGRRRSVYK